MTTYTIEHDAIESPDYPWLVLDNDGDVVDLCVTRAEAYASAKEMSEDAEKEAIIEAIDLEDLDLETLRKIQEIVNASIFKED